MAIVSFVRSVECTAFMYGPISAEDAQLQAEITVAAQDFSSPFQVDDFQEMPEILIPKHLDQRCFGGPLEVDRNSIWVDGGYTAIDLGTIHFEATQNCVFFAKDADLDSTVALATAIAAKDQVETCINVDRSTPNHWVSSAPKDFPAHILIQCAASYVPSMATKKMAIISDEELIAQAEI